MAGRSKPVWSRQDIWANFKLGYGWNLVCWALAEKLIFPDGRPEEPWSPENEQHAVTELIGLLDEFFDHLADDPKDLPGAGWSKGPGLIPG